MLLSDTCGWHRVSCDMPDSVMIFQYTEYRPTLACSCQNHISNPRWLASRSGFERSSTVNDVEDLSYVSSPFLPESVRTRWGKNLHSNAHRAHESAAVCVCVCVRACACVRVRVSCVRMRHADMCARAHTH